MDDFDAHAKLQESGLMEGHPGCFLPHEDGLRFVSPGGDVHRETRVWVEVGAQSSSRQLAELPAGFGHVMSVDAVVVLSSESEGADARTTKTLMKLDALLQASGSAGQRVVAEVLDFELARRLQDRYRTMGRADVRVYSIQDLRSFFMFESLVVPRFDLVYAELLGAWGQSFYRLPVVRGCQGCCSFGALAAWIESERGELLIGIEFDDAEDSSLAVGSQGTDGHGMVELEHLRALWGGGADAGEGG